MNRNFSLGFNFIRLIIVFIVLSSFSLFIFYIVDPIDKFQRVNDEKRKSDLTKMQDAIELFYRGNSQYPRQSKTGAPYRILRLDGVVAAWGETWIPYMDVLPKDPGSKNYVYYVSPDGQKYYLYASLDTGGKDPDSCNKGKACGSLKDNDIPDNACGGICNYEVFSRNATP